VGKVARRRPDATERLRLRTQLREAIAREDYELAARLRDQLRLKDADA
jgi:protein arginine kinase activator